MFSKEEIEAASKHYGMDLNKRSRRQRRMLVLMYQYGEGWLSEDVLEHKMSRIFMNTVRDLPRG